MQFAWPIPSAQDLSKLPSGLKFGALRGSVVHKGVDLAYDKAGLAVLAAAAGRVRYAGNLSSGGLAVYIEHPGTGWETRYYHLATNSIPNTIKAGAQVATRQLLGRVGTTGMTRSKAHLHFETLNQGQFVDPATVLGADKATTFPWLLVAMIGVAAYAYH